MKIGIDPRHKNIKGTYKNVIALELPDEEPDGSDEVEEDGDCHVHHHRHQEQPLTLPDP